MQTFSKKLLQNTSIRKTEPLKKKWQITYTLFQNETAEQVLSMDQQKKITAHSLLKAKPTPPHTK